MAYDNKRSSRDNDGDDRRRGGSHKSGYIKRDSKANIYVDYKMTDDLRRCLTPNGKIYSRKRTGASAREQRMLAQAIKRARYMALLPYTSATL